MARIPSLHGTGRHVTLTGDYENRVLEALKVAQHQARLAQAGAAPRMQDALVGLEDALSDQIAWLEMRLKTTRPMLKNRRRRARAAELASAEGRLMAARPIWRGHLRLALVSCPVALYNARHDRAGIRFNLINPETGNRIRMITQDAETGDELERRSLVKGYEFRKGKYLLLSDDDLDSVKVESSSVMTIEKFVDTASIDPVYYDSAYYLGPIAMPARTSTPCCGRPWRKPARRHCQGGDFSARTNHCPATDRRRAHGPYAL